MTYVSQPIAMSDNVFLLFCIQISYAYVPSILAENRQKSCFSMYYSITGWYTGPRLLDPRPYFLVWI